MHPGPASPPLPPRATRRMPPRPDPVRPTATDPGDPFPLPDEAVGRLVLDNLFDGVYFVDREREIRYWNPGAEHISGLSAARMVGRRCYANLLDHVDERGRQLCQAECPLAEAMSDGQPREALVYLRHAGGHRVQVRVRVAPIRGRDGSIVGAIEVFDDATPLQNARREADVLRDLAMTDALTGLANRRRFDQALEARLDELGRGGRAFGLLMIDIDHFKQVNDRDGHQAGDDVLRVVARTLGAATRREDLVARWGGEEFAALIEGGGSNLLARVAERVRALAERSRTPVEAGHVAVTVSVGFADARAGERVGDLLARADRALYEAKRLGRNRVVAAD